MLHYNKNINRVLKHWIGLKARDDWLLKLRISSAIHSPSNSVGSAPENIVIVARINELKSSLCPILT